MKAMKKLFAAACAAAIVLVSCQEESFDGQHDSDNYYASVESFGSDTRTALGEGRTVVWSSEDRIAIFEGGNVGQAYQVLDSYIGKSTGEFTSVDGLTTSGAVAAIDGTIAIYPFEEGITVSSGDNGDYVIEGVDFPSEQKYVADSFSDEAFPMVSLSASGSRNLSFKNIGGILKLSLTGSYAVSKITLTGNSGEPLSGSATVTLGSDGIPSVTMSEDASTSVSLVCDPAVQLDPETAVDFYISIPPTDFENGFTVSVSESNGEIPEYSTNKRNQVSRSHILKMPTKALMSGESEDYIKLQKDVVFYGQDLNDYISVIDENTFQVSSDIPADQIPEVNTIVYYDSARAGADVFIGRVISITEEDSRYIIHTEIPSIEEVIDDLSINLKMDSSNTIAQITPVEDDNITSCKVVDNSVWDNLQVIYEDNVVTRSAQSDNTRFPINVTLELNADANDIFDGKIYLGITGWAKLEGRSSFIMEANIRIGLDGMLGVGISGDKKVTKPILKLKHGVTLYNNKILAIRLFPQLLFFVNGKIQIEAGLNYEMMNTDMKYYCSDNNFHNNAVEQLHDNYFRVHSLHSEGEFGFELENKLYAFIFSDKFFNAGISMSAGLGIKGENNVGIQFPDFANFDFSVVGTPYLEMYPFFAYRSSGGLKNIKGPTVSASAEAFKIPLLPDIHEINYEIRNNKRKLAVTGSIYGQNTSFIESKQEGIALFKKGEEKPVAHQSISRVDTKASTGELSFDLTEGASYEIAPYVESVNDGYVYGERIPITQSLRDQLIDLYYATDGPNWTNNENWCSDKPIEEWFGINLIKDEKGIKGITLSLSDNNLKGSFCLTQCDSLFNVNVSDNLLTTLNLSGCKNIESLKCYENQLISIELSENVNLKQIACRDNRLTHINLAECKNLEDLTILNNQLASIDLSYCNKLKQLNCNNNNLVSIDLSGCNNLEFLECRSNQLTSINISDNGNLKHLMCWDNRLSSINISECKNLETLFCSDNQLNSINISDNQKLSYLDCSFNPLTFIDLSGCKYLTTLECIFTQLTTLDVSGLKELVVLRCGNNKLNSLNISDCSSLKTLQCSDNVLTSLNLSDCTNLAYFHCKNNELTSLDLSNCTNLVELYCENNKLVSSLDLSITKKLKYLYCENNKIPSINVSGNSFLREIDCVNNELHSLDASNCTDLEDLACYNNKLTSLNISGCSNIRYLDCSNNNLISLSISGFSNFEYLNCSFNSISQIIIPEFDKLLYFYYDVRYVYQSDGTYNDLGIGWWYPGEPDKGYHGR